MKILFTGASSFTSHWFVSKLAERGHEIWATFTRAVPATMAPSFAASGSAAHLRSAGLYSQVVLVMNSFSRAQRRIRRRRRFEARALATCLKAGAGSVATEFVTVDCWLTATPVRPKHHNV